MINSNINVRNAGLNIMINWKWNLKDLKDIPKNGYKVFSCFSCGGGSTMGYKLAGYDVLGNLEIDKKINDIYIKNHNPKYNFCMDIRDFNKLNEYPDELYNLDILDGSPPCTSFSMAGNRDSDWGKEKQFAEGGKLQTLDDLFFEFIRTAEILKPKIIIAENVSGIIKGKAKGYCNLILKSLNGAGYDTQIFLLNSANMGVPQSRERVFFISKQKGYNLPKLILQFNEKPVVFGEVRTENGEALEKSVKYKELLKHRKKSDRSIKDIYMRLYNKYSGYNNKIESDNLVCSTITSSGMCFRMVDGLYLSDTDFINVSTFPQDYDFNNKSVQFLVGMSVPPIMMYRISEQIKTQWLDKL